MVRTRQPEAKEAAGFFGRHSNVYVYVPNLIGAGQLGSATKQCCRCRCPSCRRLLRPNADIKIDSLQSCAVLPCQDNPGCVPLPAGYARVAAALYAFAVALQHPTAAVLAYVASFVCDELDGRFARKLNQCSTLGSGKLSGLCGSCWPGRCTIC